LLTEQAADGVFLVDRNGKFLLVNVRLCEMLGYTQEELLQLTVLDTCVPEEREAARLRLENTPVGTSLRFERHLRCKGATTIPIEASVVRLQDGNSQGIIRDITERKRVHQEALARHKLESMGLLAGGIAHDFNNLLGSILTTSELVLSDLPEDSPAVDEVRAIQRVADRGAGIVRQMMSYAGQNDPAFESVDLGPLIKEMIDLVKVSISKNAVLKVDLPEDLPAVWANAAQIRQVVMNLVINASEALGENGGRISVAAEPVFSGPGCDGVRLKVTDTGCGITDEIRSKMFDPFFTTKFAGRGLGLAVVQGIVRSHGGVLEVTSAPGEGCRIEILLPRAAGVERASGRSPQLQTDGAALPGTILVIEDEDALRHAVSQMLRKRDLKVVEVGEGQSALEAFEANPSSFDVVFVDMTLPGMPSREVLAQLRRIRPDLKVIITSAYGKDVALSIMGELQPWLYIRKPYQFTDLVELLSKICSEHKGMATTP
jgi:PAS domain S-box-containing protein